MSNFIQENCASFRFYASLNDFLPSQRRQKSFPHWFKGNPSIKDTIEALGVPHPELADLSDQQQRIVLTRDITLLKRSVVTYGYWVRNQDPDSQLQEVLNRFALFSSISPFKRCLRCNSLMMSVNKADIQEQLEPLTQKYYHEFYQCTGCHQIYWKGSHYDKLKQWIEKITETP
jgi:uncharacterized protein with PIN domain